VTFLDLIVKKQSALFEIDNDQNNDLMIKSQHLRISHSSIENGYFIMLHLYGKYSGEFIQTIINDLNCSIFCQFIAINKAYYKNLTYDSLVFEDLFVNSSKFSDKSNLIITKNIVNPQTYCYCGIKSKFNNTFFLNNTIKNSDIFFYYRDECRYSSNYYNMILSHNQFLSSTFIRLPAFQVFSSKILQNHFEDSTLLINSIDSNNNNNLNSINIVLQNLLLKNNDFTSKALFYFQYSNSFHISQSLFIDNPKETLFFIIGINITSIESCEVLNSLNRYHFSILNSRKIYILNTTIKNDYQTKIKLSKLMESTSNSSFYQNGGCITITLFENMVVQGLKLNLLMAKNSNFFEIIKDNSQENNRDIQQLEMKDSIITENTLSGSLYSVSIFNLIITQSCIQTLIFSNNSFINNTLISLTPNQINNAICFLLMSLNAEVHLESFSVWNKKLTSSLYQTSLFYLNTKISIMKNCTFTGYDDNDMIIYTKLNHIKVFATIIKILDCKFMKLGSENGGALFLSTTGSLSDDSTVLINNTMFINNSADNGGAIFFNEADFFDVINISFCSFIDNLASYGSVFYLEFERSVDEKASLQFFLTSCVFEDGNYLQNCNNGIDFLYKSSFEFRICDCLFKNMNAKLSFIGDTTYDQIIVFENSQFKDSNIFYKDLFPVLLSSLRISQYLSEIEINQINTIVFNNNIFDNISLNVSDVNFLDLTSFILMIIGYNTTIQFDNNTFSNFLIIENFDINSQSLIGIICPIFIDFSENNLLIIRNLIFSDSTIEADLYLVDGEKSNDRIDKDGINFIGGAIFILNGDLSIKNSFFFSLYFVKGSCVAAFNSIVRIVNCTFLGNFALDYASIAYIKQGDLTLAQNNLFNNSGMLKCLGKGNIKIFDNFFKTSDYQINGLINFNYENIFVYGCNKPQIEIENSIYSQQFQCIKNNVYFLTVKIKLNKTAGLFQYIKELEQFAVNYSNENPHIVLPADLISLEIIKQQNGHPTTKILLYKNTFNITLDTNSLDHYTNYLFFLIGYFDTISQIYTNIKTKKESNNQLFIIGIEIRQCPLGSLYNLTFQNCSKCSSGTFSVDPLGNSCNSCPSFGNCFDGILQPKPTFWRSSKLSSKLYFCKANPDNCLGGINSLCKTGSFGPKCESCDYDAGYVRKLNFDCSKCDIGMLFDFIFALIIFLAQIVFLFVYIYSWYNTIELTKENQNNLEETELVKHKKRLNIYVDVFSNYFQIISLIATLKSQKFPNFINEFLDLTIPTAIIDTKYCVFLYIDTKNIIYVDLFYIILVPIFKTMLFFVFWFILKKKCRKIKINKNHFILGLICLYRFEVLGQAYELFSYVSCQKIDGVSYMLKDSQFSCDYNDSGSLYFIYFWSIMLPFIILWIFVIPFAIFYSLVHNKKQNALKHTDVLERYGILYIGYKKEFYYWEFFKLLAKILFVIIAKFILFDPGRIILIIMVFCIYAISLNQFKPYAHHHFNRVEMLASIVYISSFLLFIYGEYSILYGSLDNTYDSEEEILITYNYLFSSINYVINGLFVLYLLYKMFYAVKQKTMKYYTKAKIYLNK